jgi:hypothetical protein
MGVDISIYRARIGSFAAKYKKKDTTEGWKVGTDGWQTWFWGFVLIVSLVIGGVEANPGPSVEQDKFDQIITHMRNQEKESKVIKNLLESYNQEMAEMKKRSSVISSNFEKLTKAINKVISDYKEIKQSVRQWEERHQMVKEKIKLLENGHRKNKILIFGLEERRGERYFDTLEVAKKFLRETMKLDILNESIDYVARVGKRSGEHPIIMKLTSFSMTLEVLKKTKNLVGSKFRVDEDFAWETRKIRKRLIPYLKDAKRRGHREIR